jgi:hypothetical protein
MKCLYLAVRSASTPRFEANNDRAPAGSPPSTLSPSPSKADSETLSTNRAQPSYTVSQTHPYVGARPHGSGARVSGTHTLGELTMRRVFGACSSSISYRQ